MKKYSVRIASLVLFFATGMAIGAGGAPIGMKRQRLERVYVENQLETTKTSLHNLQVIVTYTNGSTDTFIISGYGARKLLGNIDTIAKIQMGIGKSALYTVSLAQRIVGKLDDITEDFKTFVEGTVPAGPDLIITVAWSSPKSTADYSWSYNFLTNKVQDYYPWNWVINNTASEIQVKEIVDPNSLYAQEMAEQGISVGNPVKIAPSQKWQIFEENKRFQVYSKISGWFEPNYEDLERQVREGRRKDENKYKSPAISIGSQQCFGVATGCGWNFQIVWINE